MWVRHPDAQSFRATRCRSHSITSPLRVVLLVTRHRVKRSPCFDLNKCLCDFHLRSQTKRHLFELKRKPVVSYPAITGCIVLTHNPAEDDQLVNSRQARQNYKSKQ